MIKKGHWIGYYKYDKQAYQERAGFDKTNFEVEILTIENDNFIGKVQDDITTGGMEGIGEIFGKVNGDKIEFVKQMPIMTLLVNKKGTRKTFNKKHRKIYYYGTFSNDWKSVNGQWKFKFGFIWIGIIPIPIIPAKGTWTMSLQE